MKIFCCRIIIVVVVCCLSLFWSAVVVCIRSPSFRGDNLFRCGGRPTSAVYLDFPQLFTHIPYLVFVTHVYI